MLEKNEFSGGDVQYSSPEVSVKPRLFPISCYRWFTNGISKKRRSINVSSIQILKNTLKNWKSCHSAHPLNDFPDYVQTFKFIFGFVSDPRFSMSIGFHSGCFPLWRTPWKVIQHWKLVQNETSSERTKSVGALLRFMKAFFNTQKNSFVWMI